MSIQTLVEKIKEKGNPTVAGLDARLEYIPQHISGRNMMLHGETLRAAAESVVAFNCGLIDALCDIVPAVKPQAAYYELLGSYGAMALKETIDYAHAKGMYVIGDIKRNDIGATATAYAEAYLGKTRVGDTEIAPYGCDSVTVNGYLGTDGVEPFLKECRSREKSLFMLVKTSNPSSGELQNEVFARANGMKLGDVAQSMTIHDGTAYIVVNNSGIVFGIDPETFRIERVIRGIRSPRYICFNDSVAYVTSVSYTHLTLPTNREV